MSEDLNTQTREISPDQGNHAARIRDRSPAVSTRFTGKLSWTCTRDIRASAEARGLAGRSAFTPAIAQAACLAAQCGAGRPGPSCSRRVAGRPGAGSPSVIEGAARQTRYPPFCMVTGTRRYRSRRVQSRMIRACCADCPACEPGGSGRRSVPAGLAPAMAAEREASAAPAPVPGRAAGSTAPVSQPRRCGPARRSPSVPLLLCRGGLGLDEGRVLVFERLAHPAVPALSDRR